MASSLVSGPGSPVASHEGHLLPESGQCRSRWGSSGQHGPPRGPSWATHLTHTGRSVLRTIQVTEGKLRPVKDTCTVYRQNLPVVSRTASSQRRPLPNPCVYVTSTAEGPEMGTQSWATWVASKWNHKHQRRKCDGGTEVRWGVGGWEDAARPAMRMGEVPRASGQFPEPREGQETDTRSEPPGGTSPSDTLIPARGDGRGLLTPEP